MIVDAKRMQRGQGPICHGTPEWHVRATLPASGQARNTGTAAAV